MDEFGCAAGVIGPQLDQSIAIGQGNRRLTCQLNSMDHGR